MRDDACGPIIQLLTQKQILCFPTLYEEAILTTFITLLIFHFQC